MAEEYYEEAFKAGKKEYRTRVSKGQFPYLPVLDQILKEADIRTEQKVGLIKIPLELVVGTSTMGRTMSFAGNFMPIMGAHSEFAHKWASLANAQVTEGIRDPIKCYEYMNRYYVVEGNKRTSVLKFFGANEIMGEVTRKVPKESDDPEMKRYYELMRFMDLTGIHTLEFSKSGMADQILTLTGGPHRWEEPEREDFNTVLFNFQRAYEFRGGAKLPITTGDALATFMNIYGYEEMLSMNSRAFSENVLKTWNEFLLLTEHHAVDLVMDPKGDDGTEKKSLLSMLLPGSQKTLKVAFLYPKTPEESDWVYAHELGRTYLHDTFPTEIETFAVTNVTEDKVDSTIEEVIEKGADIIFGVAPQMMKPSLKAAIAHPEVKILNCSLNTPHQYIRTYYARMYEAKFLSGMIAGAMAENDKIAYIADYPLYGMIANINAFALGVSATNPRAKVYLEWSTKKGFQREQFLIDHDIHYVSDQDMITPNDESRRFGLYHYENGVTHNLLTPLWNWGVFYERLIRRIMSGVYQEESERAATNYWWGMSTGVIDLICSKHVPLGIRRLTEHIHGDIIKGDLQPFFGEFYDQNGVMRNRPHTLMNPRDVLKMDYLVDNIIGSIPVSEEYVDEAKTVIKLKGVKKD